MKKRKDNSLKFAEKRKFFILAAFLLTSLTLLLLFIPYSGNVTGSSVYVKYYGVSNYPLGSQAGNIQTYIKLTQPDLGGLKAAGGVITVANAITQAADFANGVVGAYQGNPPVPIPTGALDVVISAANYATAYFKDNTKCLSEIGSRYGSQKEVELVLVSKLAYRQCANYPDWLYAFVDHSYYTKAGKFICRQEGGKLFSIEMGTGKTSSSTFGC